MTASTADFANDWAAHPVGKVTRALIAVIGVILATLVVLFVTLGVQNAGILILLGVAIAANSIRAAMNPNAIRLATLALTVSAIPIVGQII